MKVCEYFVLCIIFTTSVQSHVIGKESNVQKIILKSTVIGEFSLLCKRVKSEGSIRWILNDKNIALVTHNGSSCSSTIGSDSRFLYTCNANEFMLTVPAAQVNRKMNGSQWACQDPHGDNDTNSITVYVAGSAKECEMSRIDSMKKWLVLTSSVAIVFFLATAVLATDKLNSKRRVEASFRVNGSIKRNRKDVAESTTLKLAGPTTPKYTGSYRDNSMYTPSDLNNVPGREHAMPLPLQGAENAMSLSKQNVDRAMTLPSRLAERSVTLSKQYVDKSMILAAKNLDKEMTLPRQIIEKDMTLPSQTVESQKSVPLKTRRQYHNGSYLYAEIRDSDLNDIPITKNNLL